MADKPLPTQASLDTVLKAATRVRVTGLPMRDQPLAVLHDTSDKSAVTALIACLKIVEDPDRFAIGMTVGKPIMEFYEGDNVIAKISSVRGAALRWDAWGWDAPLVDGACLTGWLSSRGAAL